MYHKPTFSGLYSNFNSFIREQYKVGLIFTLLFRKFSIVSDFQRFHSQVCHLNKEILKKKSFSIKLMDSCIINLHNKRLTGKSVILSAENKYLVIVLPYLVIVSLDFSTGASLIIFFLSPGRLSGRNNVTSERRMSEWTSDKTFFFRT